jgi:hypothetical protein
MKATLGRAAILAFVFWSWAPVAVALLTLSGILNALTMTAAGALVLARPGVLTRSIFFALFGLLVGTVDLRPIPLAGLTQFVVVTIGYGFVGFCEWQGVRAANHFPDGVRICRVYIAWVMRAPQS